MIYKIIEMLIDELVVYRNNPANSDTFRSDLNAAIQALKKIKQYF